MARELTYVDRLMDTIRDNFFEGGIVEQEPFDGFLLDFWTLHDQLHELVSIIGVVLIEIGIRSKGIVALLAASRGCDLAHGMTLRS